MRIVDLIGHGKDSITDRHTLLYLCIQNGLVDENIKDPNREMMDLLSKARQECVIISTNSGYYIPTSEESKEIEGYIKKEESRAKKVFGNLTYARKYLEDIKAGRI